MVAADEALERPDNKGNDQNAKRTNMNCHPTMSDSSHLLEGVFLGVSMPPEIRNSINYRRFWRDFSSVPGTIDVRHGAARKLSVNPNSRLLLNVTLQRSISEWKYSR